jgi:hypothetical protein
VTSANGDTASESELKSVTVRAEGRIGTTLLGKYRLDRVLGGGGGSSYVDPTTIQTDITEAIHVGAGQVEIRSAISSGS